MPTPQPAAVQVWKVPLGQPAEVVAACRLLLSPEESQRADGFRLERSRQRWAVARMALRLILARWLGAEEEAKAPDAARARAAALVFEQGPHGKPRLASDGAAESLPGAPQFNLSHCDDLALVAVAGDRPVGVDVERVRPLGEMRTIQERYFSAEEQAFLAAGAPGGTRAFFTLWTRREAAAKALGLDLAAALAQMRLPVYASAAAAVMPSLPGDEGVRPWWLGDLAVDSGHVGALCVQGEPPEVAVQELRLADFL